MSRFPSIEILTKMLEPPFFEEFATAINEARDRYFQNEESESAEEQLPFDVQAPIERIWCDLSDELAPVWQQQAQRFVKQYGPLPPITAEDLTSHIIPQLAGVPLDPTAPTDEDEDGMLLRGRFLRAALLLERLFDPEGTDHLEEHEEVRSVADAYELYEPGSRGSMLRVIDEFPPHWFRNRVLAEFEIDVPDFLLEEWDVTDEKFVALHKQRSEEAEADLKRIGEMFNLDDFAPSRKASTHVPPKNDEPALREIPTSDWEQIYDTSFWKSGSDAEVLLLPVPDDKFNYNAGSRNCIVRVMLDGDFTRLALNAAVERVRPAVESMLRLAMIAAEVGKEPRFWRLHTPGVRELFSTGIDLLLDDEIDRKDELSKRLHNALYLLQTERDISSDRLGLSLCFGAIESLLTIHGGGSTKQLLEHTPALLQPTAAARQQSKKVIDELYDLRSKMVHGRWVTPHPEDGVLRDVVRTLSVGVLIGVLEARTNWIRTTGETLPIKELHWQLHVCHERDQSMVGVEDLSAFLPTNVPKTKVK